MSDYLDRIAAIKPAGLIFLGPLNEISGTTAIDYSGGNRNGTYRNVSMLNQSTFLTGEPVPQWAPASADFLSLPAGFNAAYNLNEFCVMLWMRVRDASVWTDATIRILFEANRDGSNRTTIFKTTTNNQLQFRNIANGTAKIASVTTSTIEWVSLTLKNSLSAGASGEFKAFVNGVQSGATQTTLGTATSPSANQTIVGALSVTGLAPWDGYEAYVAIWTGAGNLPTDAEIAKLAIVNALAGSSSITFTLDGQARLDRTFAGSSSITFNASATGEIINGIPIVLPEQSPTYTIPYLRTKVIV